jgi:hypothetical protein
MGDVLSFVRTWLTASSHHVWILIGIVVSVLAYGVFVGRDRMVTLLLSMYLSLAVLTNAPLIGTVSRWLSVQNNPTLQLGWFLGLFLLMFFLLWRSDILRGMAFERGAWWESVLLVVLQVGLLASIILFLLPSAWLSSVPAVVANLFLGDIGRSFWLIAPLLFLAFLGRNTGDVMDLE